MTIKTPGKQMILRSSAVLQNIHKIAETNLTEPISRSKQTYVVPHW